MFKLAEDYHLESSSVRQYAPHNLYLLCYKKKKLGNIRVNFSHVHLRFALSYVYRTNNSTLSCNRYETQLSQSPLVLLIYE